MVQVTLSSAMRSAAGGQGQVEVEAATLRELLDNLAAAYPGLKPQLQQGVSVAIDGMVYNDSWFQPIAPESEVVLLPRIAGG